MEYKFVDDPDETRFRKDAHIICTNTEETQEVINTLDNKISEQKEYCVEVVDTLSKCTDEVDRKALVSHLHRHRLLYANYQLRKAIILEKLADLIEEQHKVDHRHDLAIPSKNAHIHTESVSGSFEYHNEEKSLDDLHIHEIGDKSYIEDEKHHKHKLAQETGLEHQELLLYNLIQPLDSAHDSQISRSEEVFFASSSPHEDTHDEFVEKIIQDTRRMANDVEISEEKKEHPDPSSVTKNANEDDNTLIEEEGSIETTLVTYGDVVEETVVVDRKIVKKTKRSRDKEITGFRHTSHIRNGGEISRREHTESFSSLGSEISDTGSEDTVKEVHIVAKSPQLSKYETDTFTRELATVEESPRVHKLEILDRKHTYADHAHIYDDYHHDIEHTAHEEEIQEVEDAVDKMIEEATVTAIVEVAGNNTVEHSKDLHTHYHSHDYDHEHYYDYDEGTKISDLEAERGEETVRESDYPKIQVPQPDEEEITTYDEWEETSFTRQRLSPELNKNTKHLTLKIHPIPEEHTEKEIQPKTPTTPIPDVIITPCEDNIDYFEIDEIPEQFLNKEETEELDNASVEVQTSSTVEDIDEDQLINEYLEKNAYDGTNDEIIQIDQGVIIPETYEHVERLDSVETLGEEAEPEKITDDGFVMVEVERILYGKPQSKRTNDKNILQSEHKSSEEHIEKNVQRKEIDTELIHRLESARYHDSNLNIGKIKEKVKEEIIGETNFETLPSTSTSVLHQYLTNLNLDRSTYNEPEDSSISVEDEISDLRAGIDSMVREYEQMIFDVKTKLGLRSTDLKSYQPIEPSVKETRNSFSPDSPIVVHHQEDQTQERTNYADDTPNTLHPDETDETIEFFEEEIIEKKNPEPIINDVHYHLPYSDLHHQRTIIDTDANPNYDTHKIFHATPTYHYDEPHRYDKPHHYDEPPKPIMDYGLQNEGLAFVRQPSIDVPSSSVKPIPLDSETEIGWKRFNVEVDHFTRESKNHQDEFETYKTTPPPPPINGLDFENRMDDNLPSKHYHEQPILRGTNFSHEEPIVPTPVPRRVFMEIDNYSRSSLDEENLHENQGLTSSKYDEEKSPNTHSNKTSLQDGTEKSFDMNRYEEVEDDAKITVSPRRVFMEMDNFVRQQSLTEPQSPLPTYDSAVKFPRYEKEEIEKKLPPPYAMENRMPSSARVKQDHHHEIHDLKKSKEIEYVEHEKWPQSSVPQFNYESKKTHAKTESQAQKYNTLSQTSKLTKPISPTPMIKRSSLEQSGEDKLFDMNRYEEIPELEGKTIKKVEPSETIENGTITRVKVVSSTTIYNEKTGKTPTSPTKNLPESGSTSLAHEPVKSRIFTIPQKTSAEVRSLLEKVHYRSNVNEKSALEPVQAKVYARPVMTPVEIKTMPSPTKVFGRTEQPPVPQRASHQPLQKPVNEKIHYTPVQPTKYGPNVSTRRQIFEKGSTEPELFKSGAFQKATHEKYDANKNVYFGNAAQKAGEIKDRPGKLPLYQEPEILDYTLSEDHSKTKKKVEAAESAVFHRKNSTPSAPYDEELAYPTDEVKMSMPTPVPYTSSNEDITHNQFAKSPSSTSYRQPWRLPSPREIRYKSSEDISNSRKSPSVSSTPGEIGFKYSLSKSSDRLYDEQDSETSAQKVDTGAMLISKAIAKAATVKRIEIRRKVYDTPPVMQTPPPTPLPDAFENTDQGVVAKKMSRRLFKDLEKSMAQEYKRQQEEDKGLSYSRRETMESQEKTPHMDDYLVLNRVPEEDEEKLFIRMPKRELSQLEEVDKEGGRSPSPGLWASYSEKKSEKKEMIVPERVSTIHTKTSDRYSTVSSEPEHLGVSTDKHRPIQSPTFYRLEQQVELQKQNQNQILFGVGQLQTPGKVHDPEPLPAILKPNSEVSPLPRRRVPHRHVVEPARQEEEDFRNSPAFKKILEAAEKRKEAEELDKLKQFDTPRRPNPIVKTVEEEPLTIVVTTNNSQEPLLNQSKLENRPKKASPKPPPPSPKFNQRFVSPPVIQTSKHYSIMPELEDGLIKMESAEANGFLNKEESPACHNWDPSPLLANLYKIDYEPRLEQKRNRFKNMEGHLEIPNDSSNLIPEIEKEWKKQYFRTREGRLQWYATHYADEHPEGDVLLSGAEVDANKNECILAIHGGKEQIRIVVRTPSNLFEKWRLAFLSHAASSILDSYVQPVYPPVPHYTEKIAIIELGSSAIRGGVLTKQPSLPQVFFPAIGCITDDGDVYVGIEALKPKHRHQGALVRPVEAVDSSVERYRLNKEVLKACIEKVVYDLKINPSEYKVLLSIPQNIPAIFIGGLLKTLLEDVNFKAASIARQPSLILYSNDVTTGIVVDIGERLNIVPVIDEYIVENAIVSLPFGAQQIRDSLRQNLQNRNNGIISFKSPVEHIILRNIVEQACYVATDYDDESHKDVHANDKVVPLDGFNLTPGMENKFVIDASRFQATEGLFKPKRWGLEIKGLHQLINDAVQLSPIDSRRTLFRHIYLSGGTSLLHGLAERIENELSKLVPGSIHVQVHVSPWRYHAAYLGAQIIASSNQFDKCCTDRSNIDEYLRQLETAMC